MVTTPDQSYQKVSRETFWYDLREKPYKGSYTRRLESRVIAWQAKRVPRRTKNGNQQIAEPRRLLRRVTVAVVFAGQMARLVIVEE